MFHKRALYVLLKSLFIQRCADVLKTVGAQITKVQYYANLFHPTALALSQPVYLQTLYLDAVASELISSLLPRWCAQLERIAEGSLIYKSLDDGAVDEQVEIDVHSPWLPGIHVAVALQPVAVHIVGEEGLPAIVERRVGGIGEMQCGTYAQGIIVGILLQQLICLAHRHVAAVVYLRGQFLGAFDGAAI